MSYASKNKLSDIPDDGTPNLLAFNGGGHNLTDFWAGATEEDTEAAAKLSTINIEALMDKVEKESEHLIDEVKGLVNKIYHRE